jgi:hypothetical protein
LLLASWFTHPCRSASVYFPLGTETVIVSIVGETKANSVHSAMRTQR